MKKLALSLFVVAACVAPSLDAAQRSATTQSRALVVAAQKLGSKVGLEFTNETVDQMLNAVNAALEGKVVLSVEECTALIAAQKELTAIKNAPGVVARAKALLAALGNKTVAFAKNKKVWAVVGVAGAGYGVYWLYQEGFFDDYLPDNGN